MQLAGKKVVVIGGSSGIGFGIARGSAEAGADLVIASRSAQKLAQAQAQLQENVQVLQVDLVDEGSVQSLIRQVGAIDHLVITGGRPTEVAFLELATSRAREDFEVNFWGKYYAARYAAPLIRPGGSIIFISGAYARKPNAQAVVTVASFSAIEGLSRALALALSPIRVNTIAPGIIDTPLVMPDLPPAEREGVFASIAQRLPSKSVGQPADIAQAALFLMTTPFMTGSTIRVDGGYTIT